MYVASYQMDVLKGANKVHTNEEGDVVSATPEGVGHIL